MRIHVLPGIHTGAVSCVEGLLPYLTAAGFEVVWVDYGFILGIETRLVNPLILHTMLPYIAKGDLLLGHSNGAAIAYTVMQAGAPVKGCVFINGALEQRITRSVGVDFIECLWNPGDDITEVAAIGQKIGIDSPVWGAMGHGGYIGTDSAITNINCGATPGLPAVSGHSDFFTTAKLAAWGPYLVNSIRARLGVPVAT
jgi:hypothetical protein